MKRLSILISLSFSLFFPSCQTVREVAEIPAADPVEWILINGDVFVEKENPKCYWLFSAYSSVFMDYIFSYLVERL